MSNPRQRKSTIMMAELTFCWCFRRQCDVCKYAVDFRVRINSGPLELISLYNDLLLGYGPQVAGQHRAKP